jgi:hypothetical protein
MVFKDTVDTGVAEKNIFAHGSNGVHPPAFQFPFDATKPPKRITVTDHFLTLFDNDGNGYSLSIGGLHMRDVLDSIEPPQEKDSRPSDGCTVMPQCEDYVRGFHPQVPAK